MSQQLATCFSSLQHVVTCCCSLLGRARSALDFGERLREVLVERVFGERVPVSTPMCTCEYSHRTQAEPSGRAVAPVMSGRMAEDERRHHWRYCLAGLLAGTARCPCHAGLSGDGTNRLHLIG